MHQKSTDQGITEKKVFQAIKGRAGAANGLYYILIGLGIVALLFDLLQLNLIIHILNGVEISGLRIEANDSRQVLITSVYLIFLLTSVLAFLIWVHRAYKNLPAFGYKPKTTPGMAIIYFFIPIVNFVAPYQCLKEIWIGSYSALHDNQQKIKTGFVLWLWLIWIFKVMAGSEVSSLLEKSETIQQLFSVTGFAIFDDIMGIFVAVLTLIFINKITAWQDQASIKMNQSA